jgi:hypothetical protein
MFAANLYQEFIMEKARGIGMLFDLSFSEFVTTRIIKVIFVICIIFAGIGTLGLVLSGFGVGAGAGLLCLIASPIVFLLYVLAARVWCELIMVVFRIAENTGRLVDRSTS